MWKLHSPRAAKLVEADYYVPLLAHASMEPLVALADFRDGQVTVWAPTQDPQGVQETVAKAVGIAKENVICHVTLLGGGFGRKSKADFRGRSSRALKEGGASGESGLEPVKTTSASTTTTRWPRCI